ncbi:MAG: PAS domain S-box protein [Oscillatoriophycideae cyanobacterium NC_groundwater_1537_Pr4_S-0.65um_50_18]|nr:PAS domain S-box protein [Oscillatoriophycideae cyanobacterium NC_groundwater_1537_Pr4_S-0.65um_50_18]
MYSGTTLFTQDLQSAIARNPLVVSPDATVIEAIALMSKTGSDYVLIGEGGRLLQGNSLVGILTKRDLVRITVQSTPLNQLPIQAVMSQPVIILKESEFTDLSAALALFQHHRIHHLPILDNSDRVVGLLHQDALTELLAQHVLSGGGEQQGVEGVSKSQHESSPPSHYSEELSNSPSLENLENLGSDIDRKSRSFALSCSNTELAAINEELQRLLKEVRAAEEEVRQQAIQLEIKIEERTAELRRYERMVNASGDSMLLIDRHYRYQVINQAYQDNHDKSRDEILGHSVAEVMGQTLFEHVLKSNLDQAFAGQMVRQEMWVTLAGKAPQYVSVSWSPYLEADQTISGAVVTARDITDLKQTEAELRESERRYVTLAAAAPVTIFRFDAPFHCVYVNDRWSEMTGRSTESALGRGWIDALHPDDRDELLAKWAEEYAQAPSEQQMIIQSEGRHLHLDGSVKWFYVQVVQETDDEGAVTGYIGTLTDITDRKQVEAALQKSEQRYRALMDGASDAIVLGNSQGNLIEGNQKAEVLLGYSREELTQLHMSQLHPPTVLEAACQHFNHVVLHKVNTTLQSIVLRKDGSQVPVEITASRIDLDGEHFAQGIFRDVSERVRLEADRQRAEQENQRLQERLQFVLSESPAVIFTCRPGGDYRATFISDNIYDMTGHTSAQFLAEPSFWADHLHPDDAPQVFAELPQLLERGCHIHEYRFQHQAGHYLWIHAELRLVRDHQGTPIEMVGYLVDISDRKRFEDDQKQAEEALQLSEERFRKAFDTTAVGMCIVSPEGKFLKVNGSLCNFWGYSEAELLNLTFQELTHPEDLSKDLDLFQQMLAGEIHSYHLEKRYVTKQEQWVWGLLSVSLVRDAQEQPLYFVSQIQDISDRKQAEIRLQQQSDREHLVNSISQRIRASLNLQEILNTTVSEVHQVLQADRVLVYRILPDNTGQTIAESVSAGWPVILDQIFPEERFPPENYSRYVQGRVFALSDRETGLTLRCLVDFLKDMQVRAKLVTPIIQNQTLWGLLVAHQCSAPRQWQPWEIELMQQLSGQLAIAIQQSELYAQLQASHQQLTHTNAELIRATRLKDEFLANMSHELRTPLNVILGMTEGLQEEVFGTLNDRQKKAVSTVERSGKHLLSLINDILEVSKIAADKLELKISMTSVTHLCTASLMFVKQLAFKKQIHLVSILPPGLADIAVDERRMQQVLINLLTNAVKFTPTGGRVTLRVHLEPLETNLAERISLSRSKAVQGSPDNVEGLYCQLQDYYLCISVMDTGIGIAPADQSKLFQPFVQLDSNLNRQYEGTGLGLVMVKQIVELHQGFVSLHSKVGEGSCFTLHIPYMSSLPPRRAIHPTCLNPDETLSHTLPPPNFMTIASSRAIASPLILLAEDNEANISTISSYLKAKGYRLLLARQGQEAIDLAQAHQPDLILMDIQMPGVDGLEAMRQIRLCSNLVNTPIVALTALVMAGDREKCIQAGANDYLSKPVQLKQLVSMIQQLLNARNNL